MKKGKKWGKYLIKYILAIFREIGFVLITAGAIYLLYEKYKSNACSPYYAITLGAVVVLIVFIIKIFCLKEEDIE